MTLLLCSMFPIDLLQGSEHICGMMSVNIVMMMVMMNIFFKWYDNYRKRKAQKVSIKDKLMPITWHPSRW